MYRIRGAVLGCLLACTSALVQAEVPTQAVWQEHEFDFTYMGFTTQYSCEGLKYKVRKVLETLGARENPDIRATGCEIGGGVAMSPRIHVRVALPQALQDGAEAADAFAAAPGTVHIAPRASSGIAMGDCELVEQLARQVLPELGTEVVSMRTGCVPHQLGLGRPLLEARVLKPLAENR